MNLLTVHALPRLDGSPADGIHLLWSPPVQTGYSQKGYTIWRRVQSGNPPTPACFSLTPDNLKRLHSYARLSVRDARLSYWTAEPTPDQITALSGNNPPVTRLHVYHIHLSQPSQRAQLRLPAWLGIAILDGKTIDSRMLSTQGGILQGPLDQIVLYALQPIPILEVCLVPLETEAGWAAAEKIAEELQIPFQAANPALTGLNDELALARSRLVGDETLHPGAFEHLSQVVNMGLAPGNPMPLTYRMHAHRSSPDDPFFHLPTWSLPLTLSIDSAWRRALGFAFLDPAAGLSEGTVYNYRITGWFRQSDLYEDALNFATVPLGMAIGSRFALDGFVFHAHDPRQVEAFPPVSNAGFVQAYQKGIRVEPRLTIRFPQPLQRVVLLFTPEAGLSLHYTAGTFMGTIDPQPRVTLEWASPVDSLTLEGSGFFIGILSPALPAGHAPEELVELSAVAWNVPFIRTPFPQPPTSLEAANLQQDWRSGERQPAHLPGFRVRWQPPQSGGQIPLALWPEDLPAYPPSEVSHYMLERRTAAGEFHPYDADGSGSETGWIFANHLRPQEPVPFTPGADLLTVYPPRPIPDLPVSPWVEYDDVLTRLRREEIPGSPIQRIIWDGPQPGERVQYRVWSLDVLGRRSETAALSQELCLEKHLIPPSPPGPALPLTQDGGTAPLGVSARVVQRRDPILDTPGADPALVALLQQALGSRDQVTLLSWGWGLAERNRDPWVTEFRIYWRNRDPAQVEGRMIVPAQSEGALYQVKTKVEPSLRQNEFAGQILELSGQAFPIARHDAGNAPVFWLKHSQAQAGAVPQPGAFRLARRLTGAESRPPAWEERIRTVPIKDQESYVYVVERDLLIDPATGAAVAGGGAERTYYEITPEDPRQRGFFGISAADQEDYVPDSLEPGIPLGGRAGNESAITPAAVFASYRGRPAFSPPAPPLEAELETLAQLEGEQALRRLEISRLLPGLVPAGGRLLVERAASADLLSLLTLRADGIYVRHPKDRPEDERWILPPDQEAEVRRLLQSDGELPHWLFWRLATRGPLILESAWQRACPEPVEYAAGCTELLPTWPERYIYRVRLVNKRGTPSAEAAYLPRVFQVPNLQSPPGPVLQSMRPLENQVVVRVTARQPGFTAGVLLFLIYAPPEQAQALVKKGADLLRIPNRPDLYPARGARLRLKDGRLAEDHFLPASGASPISGQRATLAWEAALRADYRSAVLVWAAAVSTQGVLSPLVGPLITLTGSPPPDVPDLRFNNTSGLDELSWTTPPGHMARLEARDGEADWRPVSPWIPAAPDSPQQRTLEPSNNQSRSYRLLIRNAEGRQADGEPVAATA